MNIELIKKYKEEFDWWLSKLDSSILIKRKGGKVYCIRGISDRYLWDEHPDTYESIIINDEYVEFRKALSEGKDVEWNHSDPIYCEPKWLTVERTRYTRISKQFTEFSELNVKFIIEDKL